MGCAETGLECGFCTSGGEAVVAELRAEPFGGCGGGLAGAWGMEGCV